MQIIISIFNFSNSFVFIFVFFSDKEKLVEPKPDHELSVINSFETALIEHHDLSHNELLQHSEILNDLPSHQQPVIVRPPSTKLPRMLLDNDGNMLVLVFILFLT